MSDFTCAQVNEAAAEFALGILAPDERESVEAHLQRCPTCRLEVESMQSVGTQLLDLVPGTEPPLGFDRRVLSRVKPAPPDGYLWRRRHLADVDPLWEPYLAAAS